jgi:hypothetical protein
MNQDNPAKSSEDIVDCHDCRSVALLLCQPVTSSGKTCCQYEQDDIVVHSRTVLLIYIPLLGRLFWKR